MTFDELLNLVSSDKTPEIRIDSRLVKAGDVFVAIKGTNCDGHDFIGQAIAKGAKYIVCQRFSRHPYGDGIQHRASSIEIIDVEDSSEAAGLLAQAKAGNPASQLINLAVTGTNGKTTTAYLVRSVIQTAGKRCGLIGTVEYDTGSAVCQASMTTPDCLEIACIQKEMVKAGCEYMVIEASSHALSQNRLAGIDFKAAAFTNLTGDHLDYHKTLENYLADKTKLFSALSPDAAAVLNRQSPQSKHIAEKTRARVLWYAIDEPADITAHIESMDINGTVFALQHVPKSSIVNRQSSIVKTLLLGLHNVSNHLAAAGLCLAAGFDLETVAAGLSALQGVPGRLEKVEYTEVGGQGSGFRERAASDERFILRSSPRQVGAATENGRATSDVLVDYAHTDDALKNVLTTLKPLCKGRLIVVFGCGGDRDRTKRPRMAKVAEELADIVIVTSDNPRTEKPKDIIDEIIAGFSRTTHDARLPRAKSRGRTTKWIEPDRRKAIELAIKTAVKDDIVLIAGKGHENYQIIGTKKSPFSDKTIALQYFKKLKPKK
jgi:UDP-N-acetylmuramoyl-L-alanyl-D-glutamate--2,6-diaminopimelate ligase